MEEGAKKKNVEGSKNKKQWGMEEKIRRRVACEERAFRIVEKVVDTTITESYLCDIAAYIDQTIYEDIVEERSITKICGYPICNKSLARVLQQKYHISTLTNNVYDITRRKRFCSAQCFKASEYYFKQIPTSPVWSRGLEKPPQIKLLPREVLKGGAGDSLIVNPRSVISKELNEITKLDQERRKDKGDGSNKKVHFGCSKDKSDDICDKPYTVKHLQYDEVPDHINRAEYYGYDSTQQALKAVVCCEVVNHKHNTEKCTNTRLDSHLSRNIGYASGDTKEMPQLPYAADQIERTTNVITEENKKSFNNELNIQIPDTDIQHSSPLRTQSETLSEVSVSNSDQQSKTDVLMKLLDKKQMLTEQLKQQKAYKKHEDITSQDSLQSTGLHTTNSDNKSSVNTDGVSSNRISAVTNKDNTSLNQDSSNRQSQVLENIERAASYGGCHFGSTSSASQQTALVDSDDEPDREGDHQISDISDSLHGLTVSKPTILSTTEPADVPLSSGQLTTRQCQERHLTLHLINGIILQWRTPDTVKYLRRDKTYQSALDESKSPHSLLSEKINAQIQQHSHLLTEDHHDQDTTLKTSELNETEIFTKKIQEFYSPRTKQKPKQPSKPLPDMSSLMSEQESLPVLKEKKIKLFQHEQELEITPYDRSEFLTEREVSLPYIDSKSQVALRRRIVLDRLTTALSSMLGHLQLSMRDISQDLRALVTTFNLTSENIILQPSEWTLVAYFILRLIAKRNKTIKRRLKEGKGKNFFETMLSCVGISTEMVKDSVREFTKQ